MVGQIHEIKKTNAKSIEDINCKFDDLKQSLKKMEDEKIA